MNKAILKGRLTGEPNVSETQGGKKIARFNLAVDRMKEGADFPSIIAWEKKAEFVEKYCHKGTSLLIEGRIQTGSYDKDGHKVYTTDIIAENFEFCEKRNADEEQPTKNQDDGFMKIPDGIEQELPFA